MSVPKITSQVTVEVTVELMRTPAGEAAIQRYVNLPADNEYAASPGMAREQVELTLIEAALRCGVDDASRLDGWADIADDDLWVLVREVSS